MYFLNIGPVGIMTGILLLVALYFLIVSVKANSQRNKLTDNFLEGLPGTILGIDVDTTRFVEYIWGYRAKFNLGTGAYISSIPGTNSLRINAFSEMFLRDHPGLQNNFLSDIVWRGIEIGQRVTKSWWGGTRIETYPKLMVSITRYNKNESYSVVILGEPETVAKWQKYFKETYQAPSIKKVQIVTGLAKDGSLRFSDQIIQEESADIGYDEFYPYLPYSSIDELARAFEAAKENVLVMIGPFGTGKSTLIRTLMLKMGIEHFGICNDHKALEHPEIVQWMSGFPDKSMICLEDADKYIGSRADGNSHMSALLNQADGIMRNNRKIIISTNLPNVNSIDEALLRDGRCFGIIHSRNLTIQEANIARAKLKMEPLPTLPDNVTRLGLASALNFKLEKFKATPRKEVGFQVS